VRHPLAHKAARHECMAVKTCLPAFALRYMAMIECIYRTRPNTHTPSRSQTILMCHSGHAYCEGTYCNSLCSKYILVCFRSFTLSPTWTERHAPRQNSVSPFPLRFPPDTCLSVMQSHCIRILYIKACERAPLIEPLQKINCRAKRVLAFGQARLENGFLKAQL
jgi:hypothetical protein